MFKSPIGTRFITASKQCVIKLLSKNITVALKLFYRSMEFTHEVYSFWVILNNKLSNRKAAKSISTCGFSILYTNILHDKLIKTLNSPMDFDFKCRT